jgi:hypothetical protein
VLRVGQTSPKPWLSRFVHFENLPVTNGNKFGAKRCTGNASVHGLQQLLGISYG